MYTFNGKDNDAMKALCKENGCELVIVPHNLTIKFQPLDISINQKAKKFISHKFNTWYAERVSTQLPHGIAPADVKVSMKLSELKPLHAKWIVDHLRKQNEALLNALLRQGLPKPFDLPMTFTNFVKIHLRREDKWKDEFLAFVIDFIVQTLKRTIHKKIIAVLLRYLPLSSFNSCGESLFML